MSRRSVHRPVRLLLFLGTVVVLIFTSAPHISAAGGANTCFGKLATIVGSPGDDVLVGTPGDDVIQGLGGHDVIHGKAGHDLLCGGTGDDTIRGGLGRDLIIGGAGADTIRGQQGRDALSGLSGADLLVGGPLRDVALGHGNNDILAGGAGGDFLDGKLGVADQADGGINRDWCKAENEVSCEGPAGPFRLKANGLGGIGFGTPTDIALVEFALLGDPADEGDPDEDTGWIDAPTSPFGVCPGDEVRMVRWGNVRTFFTRVGLTEGEFFTWQVDGFGGFADKRLVTPNGLRLGDTRGQLELLYKVLNVEFLEPFGFWHFYAQNNPSGISGTLSDGSFGAGIQFMQGGIGCGE